MKKAALLLSLQHAVLSDPHWREEGGKQEGAGRGEGGTGGRREDSDIKTRYLMPKQERSVQPPDSLLPVDLSEELAQLFLFVYDSIVPLCMRGV